MRDWKAWRKNLDERIWRKIHGNYGWRDITYPRTYSEAYAGPDGAYSRTVTKMPDWYYTAHPWAKPVENISIVNKLNYVDKNLSATEAACYW